MTRPCVVVVRKGKSVFASSYLIERCGFSVREVDGMKLGDRQIQAIIDGHPVAVVMPLSLPRFAAVRFAELLAHNRSGIRSILVSESDAPTELLEELFDRRLRPLADGLMAALAQPDWRHAFERRTLTLDVAIRRILKKASCLWLNRRDPRAYASLEDYQRVVVASARPFKVLFIASDPTDAARLRLMDEYSVMDNESTKLSKHPFSLKPTFSSRPDELMRRLFEEQPDIVHVSGHGCRDGRLCFEDAAGKMWPADQAAIAAMFEPFRQSIECVVLNSCFSAQQAQLIGSHIEYAIGLSSSVSDPAAIALAKGFYGCLSATGKVSNALDAARANIQLWAGENTELYYTQRSR